jgi:hypothetical protein
MDAKGGIDPAEWRQFCSELVPLAEFDKYCWSEDEVFQAHVKVANFTGEDLLEGESDYEISRPVAELLDGVKAPARIDLPLAARTAGYEGVNSWHIWVYPADNKPDKRGITIVRNLDKVALAALEAGKRSS